MHTEKGPIANSYLEVDMARLRGNVRRIYERLQPGAALIPVLKDDAFGLGLIPVGRALAAIQGIQTLAVAHTAEGIALRRQGVMCEILVMAGMPTAHIREALAHKLTLPLWRPGITPLCREALSGDAVAHAEIKIETGLNRIGVAPGEELAALIKELRQYKDCIHITGAFSHFADTENKAFTEAQYLTFLKGAAQLSDAGIAIPRRHICGSAAFEYYPQYHMDAVRIGRGLYMDHPTKPHGGVEEVASWRSFITAIRTLPAGATLGYGTKYVLPSESRVATVCAGYGDGLNRELAQVNAPVLVRGRRGTLLGCCMDQCFVDVTGINCAPDDEATFFGRDGATGFLSAQAVALLAGGDEGCGLTSALSGRVMRTYI
ncbi:MAG: alanine racemase [Clostridiales bacterium]|jgi:alanine racemase|nr:alanine racemase [Clostridiales bacterium]